MSIIMADESTPARTLQFDPRTSIPSGPAAAADVKNLKLPVLVEEFGCKALTPL